MATQKAKSANQTITVKVNEENPEPLEVIAESVIQVADAFQRVKNSRLAQRAIILLIKDAIPPKYKVGVTEIQEVLNAAAKLKQHYIK
jgi:hypothetical protein